MNCEVQRIQEELDNLDSEFAEDGIVKTVLRRRILQEKRKVLLEEEGEINHEL
jgi:hypothetical protein